MRLKEFASEYGRPYSEVLGISLQPVTRGSAAKWFLASLLYSKPIREDAATKTYRCFESHGVVDAESIVNAGWDRLVQILDEGGYTRYDFSTADKLLEVFSNLQDRYGGDLTRLYAASKDSAALENNLKRLGKGIGDTTVSIFLRDLRPVWIIARPKPTPLVKAAMEALGIRDLEKCAHAHRVSSVRLETALLRYSKNFLKKGKEIKIAA